jgi:hypothetical protein
MVFDVEWLVVQWILSDPGKMEGDERMLCMVWSDAKIYQYYKGFWDKSQVAERRWGQDLSTLRRVLEC